MRSKILSIVMTLLAAALAATAQGCYTILAVDDSPEPAQPLPAEPGPIVLVLPPPPPPPPVYVSMPVHGSGEPGPRETVQRTSGPQRETERTSSPAVKTEQRPVRTGRGG